MKVVLALAFVLLAASCDAPGGGGGVAGDVTAAADSVGADAGAVASGDAGAADETGGPVVPDVVVDVAVAGPRLCVSATDVQFGAVEIGAEARKTVTVSHCGTEGELAISALSLHAETAPAITLDLTAMGFGELPGLNAPHPPLALGPGAQASFDVVYRPTAEGELNEVGAATPDVGLLKLVSNASPDLWQGKIAGFGVAPVPVKPPVLVVEGEEVIPQTKLHLVGSDVTIENGPATRYLWSVHQPVGSKSVFRPSSVVADPTFEANVAGVYTFDLTVWDQDDQPTFFPAFVVVTVIPDQALHIELLWDTPGDPDETDEGPDAGADLDLHFTHPFAGGEDVDGDGEPDGWFDQPFDCFWFNAHPDWASAASAAEGKPGLDRDDVDGAGPENINYDQPKDGLDYGIGVHYWEDHGFGPSTATVRVYVYGGLGYEATAELKDLELWEVGSIAWPSGKVTRAKATGGGPRIISNYKSPFFPSP